MLKEIITKGLSNKLKKIHQVFMRFIGRALPLAVLTLDQSICLSKSFRRFLTTQSRCSQDISNRLVVYIDSILIFSISEKDVHHICLVLHCASVKFLGACWMNWELRWTTPNWKQ